MRKIIRCTLIIFIAIVLLSFAFATVACDDISNTVSEHTFSEEWVIDDTYHWHECTDQDCSVVSGEEQHDLTVDVVREPTCVQKGEEVRTCKICGFSERVETDFAEHVFRYSEGVAPTCLEDGFNDYKECEVCGYSTYEALPATGHNMIEVPEKEATCTEDGWRAYSYCSNCGYNTKTTIEASGHDWLSHQTVPSSCIVPGKENYCVCVRCNAERYDEIPATGHDLEIVQAKTQSCTEYGWNEYECCTKCNYSTQEVLLPFGHDLVDHTCIRCDKSLYDSALYGYAYLGTMADGEKRQAMYDEIAAAAMEFHKATNVDVEPDAALLTVDFASYGLTLDDAVNVWKTFKDDHPIYYWLSSGVYYSDTTILPVIDSLYAQGETRKCYNALIDEEVMRYADMVFYAASDYETALCYHDNILLAVDYSYDEYGYAESELWAHNIIGVFEKRGAVCEGYSRTFQLLLNYSNIENLFVTGVGGGGKHAWNLVKLDDGEWYWVDLTFNDAGKGGVEVSYDYFCKTDNEFLTDHAFDSSQGGLGEFMYELPERSDHVYKSDGPDIGTIFSFGSMTYEIIGYNSLSMIMCNDVADAVIPESVEYEGRTMKVVEIGSDGSTAVFQYNDIIRSVYIPKTIRMIWDFALTSDTLEKIEVAPDNDTYTSLDGVLYTKNHFTLIKIPSASDKEELIIPDATVYIAQNAVSSCKNLRKIHFGKNVSEAGITNWGYGYPDGKSFVNIIVGEIGRMIDALTGEKQITVSPENNVYTLENGCMYNKADGILLYVFDKSITSFKLPANIVKIGEGSYDRPFDDCMQLSEFVVEEGNKHFKVYEKVLYSYDFSSIIAIPKAIQGFVPVVEGVKEIPDQAFANCVNITSISLPSTLTNIKYKAFSGCVALENIIIPAKVTIIENSAFYGCKSLKSATLNAGLINIGTSAFSNCSSLEKIVIPASVESIGAQAFYKCEALEYVVFEKTSGWEASFRQTVREIHAYELSNSSVAKEAVTVKYVQYSWNRSL